MLASFSVMMALDVFIGIYFVVVSRIAQMEAMRMLLLVKKSVSHTVLRFIPSPHATRTVAYFWIGPAVLKLSPCVRMVGTWLIPCARASVTLFSQEVRTHIGGLVPMAPRGVSFGTLAVMGIQIVALN